MILWPKSCFFFNLLYVNVIIVFTCSKDLRFSFHEGNEWFIYFCIQMMWARYLHKLFVGEGRVWAGFPPAGVSQDAVPHPEDPGSWLALWRFWVLLNRFWILLNNFLPDSRCGGEFWGALERDGADERHLQHIIRFRKRRRCCVSL